MTPTSAHTYHLFGGYIVAPVTGGYDVVDPDGEVAAYRLPLDEALELAEEFIDRL